MSTAPAPADESARLDALRRCRILDTAPEQAYDDIVRLAAKICEAPAAAINLIDHQRVWVKAHLGCGFGEVPRSESICEQTIRCDETLIVPDASRDARFIRLPDVRGGLGVRFYAGVPLCTPDGHALGTLCVLDYHERHLHPEQLACLRALGRQAASQLELRRVFYETERLETERRQAAEALRESENRFQAFMENSPAVAFIKDERGRYLYVSGPLTQHFNRPASAWTGRTDFDLWSAEVAHALRESDRAALASSKAIAVEESMPTDGLGERCWLTHKFVLRGADGSRKIAGLAIDITERKQAEREHERLVLELRRSQQYLRLFMDRCPVAAFIKDEDGRYLYVNKTLADCFLKPAGEWLGHTNRELWGEEAAHQPDARDREVLADGRLNVQETAERTPDGVLRHWLSHKFLLQDADGRREIAGLSLDITARKQAEAERERFVAELRAALAQVKTLRGFLPICAVCKNVRDDAGYWQQIESYLAAQTDLEFSHGLCPDCVEKLYPDFVQECGNSAGESAAPKAGDDH